MARVQIETQGWGWYSDYHGNGLSGRTVTCSGTVYTTAISATPISPIVTNSLGVIPGWIDEGTYTTTIDGVTRNVEAITGGNAARVDRLIFNAKNYGITGLGLVDESVAIEAFYNAIPAGSVAYFPDGIYIGLHDPDKQVNIVGDGKHLTEFRPPAAPPAASKLVDFGSSTKCSLIGVKLNAQNVANIARGVNCEGNGTDKHLLVSECWFENFSSATGIAPHGAGAAAIYVWTADVVEISNCNFVDCIYGPYMDGPSIDCQVINNKIACTGGAGSIGRTGITMRRTSSAASGSLVAFNIVENIRSDPGGIGQEGSAIDLVKVQGVRCIGNTCRDAATAGIHIGGGSYGAMVIGNNLSECTILNGGAIYVELNIGQTNPTQLNLTSGRRNGCTIMGNTIFANTKYGMSVSYAAGSMITANTVYENGREGIFVDSDYVSINGNQVYNNNNLDLAAAPTSTPNVQAQIRITTGFNCIISDNTVTDNQVTPTSDYGIAVANNSHAINSNQATGTVGDIYNGGVTNEVQGYGTRIKESGLLGTVGARMGRATLVAGTVTVSTNAITANSEVFLTCQTAGGTPGFLRKGTVVAATSFVITSSSASDTSVVGWMIVEPG